MIEESSTTAACTHLRATTFSHVVVLEQLSISLSRQSVANAGEPSDGILVGDRLDSQTCRLL